MILYINKIFVFADPYHDRCCALLALSSTATSCSISVLGSCVRLYRVLRYLPTYIILSRICGAYIHVFVNLKRRCVMWFEMPVLDLDFQILDLDLDLNLNLDLHENLDRVTIWHLRLCREQSQDLTLPRCRATIHVPVYV